MLPNIYMHEKLVYERRQALLREAEQQRRLAGVQPTPHLHWLRRLVAGLGRYFVAVGTRLQCAQAVE